MQGEQEPADWLTRDVPGEPMDYEINLGADLAAKVSLVQGMRVGGWWVPETRNYTIAEIRQAVARAAAP